MRTAALLAAIALTACVAPPAWVSGDPPLTAYAPDDALWSLFEAGCGFWYAVDLQCERAADPDSATVVLGYFETGSDPRHAGLTKYDPLGEHLYTTTIRRDHVEAFVVEVAAHEIGHLLTGQYEPGHLATGPALMTSSVSADHVTDADLDFVFQAWGRL